VEGDGAEEQKQNEEPGEGRTGKDHLVRIAIVWLLEEKLCAGMGWRRLTTKLVLNTLDDGTRTYLVFVEIGFGAGPLGEFGGVSQEEKVLCCRHLLLRSAKGWKRR
jgi:hypothetical protein